MRGKPAKGFRHDTADIGRLGLEIGIEGRSVPLELGPPVGWPLKFRVSGPDPARVRDFAQSFASLLGNTPSAQNINFDWNEPSKVVRVEVDQDRARALGISSAVTTMSPLARPLAMMTVSAS